MVQPTNKSLMLKMINKSMSGRYSCQGRNTVGVGESNTVILSVKCKKNYLYWLQRSLAKSSSLNKGENIRKRTKIKMEICKLQNFKPLDKKNQDVKISDLII